MRPPWGKLTSEMVEKIAKMQLVRRTREVLVGGIKAARFALKAVRLQALLAWRPNTQTPPPWDHVWDRLDQDTDRLMLMILTVPPLTFMSMWFIGRLGGPQVVNLPLGAGLFILATQFMRYSRFVWSALRASFQQTTATSTLLSALRP